MPGEVNFTRPAAERIARAVRAVEFGVRDGGGPVIDRPWYGGGGGGGAIRLGTISTTWDKGSDATVRQIKGNGDAITPTVEFTAKNWFAKVTVTTGTKKVACAKVDSTWILIAAEC